MTAPAITIEPADASLDQARSIRLHGFGAEPVTLRATLRHPDGSLWRSEASFQAGDDGRVDLARQAPLHGDWGHADAMAPVWAMQRLQAPVDPSRTDEVAPLTITLDAHDSTGRQASAEFVQRYVVDGVERREIATNGIVGTLFQPAGSQARPAIVVMNGSGGGIPRQRAAQFAAQGYSALALGYFKAPGLPDYISATPLEYFERALRWVHETLAPAGGFVAVTGQSRGGELALLLGARFPQWVKAVIAYVPSAVVHGTLRAGRPGEAPDSPVWTWGGEPLPNVWQNNPDVDWSAFNARPTGGAALRQAPAFDTALRNVAAVAAARIPVERIAGPVMLVSGTDDGFWPSARFADDVAASLREHGHRWPVEHVRCEGAGHGIGLPHGPTTLIERPHPVAGLVLSAGGKAAANARANAESWHAVQRFLREATA